VVRHNLIAYRDDYPGDHQPIAFAAEHWRRYIPIAFPSTICIRERLPPGRVAALINRAHPFPDLALFVDAFEDRLRSAMDGRRTLAEIVEVTRDDRPDALQRALSFFERLWRYDQVVFDASGAS
jgi:hypothetical protein